MKKLLQLQIDDYEDPVKELIGKSILSINYYEINYDESFWNNVDYHSLDYGLELEMNNNETYYFIWDKQFFQHDVKFTKGKIEQELIKDSDIRKTAYLNSLNAQWKEVVGKKIIAIKSIWSYCSDYYDSENKTYYPETIKIQFENKKSIWISAIDIRDGATYYMADHISIFFDEMTLRKYNIATENEV